jgi:flagellar motor switch protein FliM
VDNSSIAVESPPGAETQPASRGPESFNFHNPGHSIREGIRRLEVAHEVFAGRFERALSDAFGATISLELQGIQQSTFTRYLEGLPVPGILGVLSLNPFPGTAVLEISSQVALPLIETMLGGSPEVGFERKLTPLERELVREVANDAVDALATALEPLGLTVEAQMWEADAQFIEPPAGELAILVKYGVTFGESGFPQERLVISYPLSALQAIAEGKHDTVEGDVPKGPPAKVADHLPEVLVPFFVHLQPSTVPYGDVVALEPGDVLRLDHALDDPVIGLVGDRPVLAGRLGTSKHKLALEIAGWIDS